jgi:hypothetical protein
MIFFPLLSEILKILPVQILVRASDFRVKGQGHHMNVIATISYILGEDKKVDSEYLDSCRKKRNIVEYDCVDGATEKDVTELREFIVEFRDSVSNINACL